MVILPCKWAKLDVRYKLEYDTLLLKTNALATKIIIVYPPFVSGWESTFPAGWTLTTILWTSTRVSFKWGAVSHFAWNFADKFCRLHSVLHSTQPLANCLDNKTVLLLNKSTMVNGPFPPDCNFLYIFYKFSGLFFNLKTWTWLPHKIHILFYIKNNQSNTLNYKKVH